MPKLALIANLPSCLSAWNCGLPAAVMTFLPTSANFCVFQTYFQADNFPCFQADTFPQVSWEFLTCFHLIHLIVMLGKLIHCLFPFGKVNFETGTFSAQASQIFIQKYC